MKQSLRMLWERRRNTRQLRRPQTWPKFKIPASRCCAAVQEKSHDQVITREIKRASVVREITKQ